MPDELIERVDAIASRTGGSSGSRLIAEIMAHYDNEAEDLKRDEAERARKRKEFSRYNAE